MPVNAPGLVARALPMLARGDGPLGVRWTPHLLRMAPWALGFARHCEAGRVERSALALGTLLRQAADGYDDVFAQAGVDVDGPMGEHTAGGADPALAGRAQADSVVVLLDSGRPADRRIATMAEDMVAAEGIPVWRIPSALPVDLQVIEFEAVLNRLMLDVIIEGDVDQCHWPGHDGESALYHVVR